MSFQTFLSLTNDEENAKKLNPLLDKLAVLSGKERISFFFIILEKMSSGNNSPDNRRIQKVRDYVSRHFASDIRLEDVAAQAFLCKHYFCPVFKKQTGVSFYVYLQTYRIERAALMLTETGRQVSEILLSCGFNNQAHFNKVFLKQTGTTPSEYRKLHVRPIES
jgi:AraC-like DNA-binding protein